MKGFKNIHEMCEASKLLDANGVKYVQMSPKLVKVFYKDDLEIVESLLGNRVKVVEYKKWDGKLSQEEIDRLTVKKSK